MADSDNDPPREIEIIPPGQEAPRRDPFSGQSRIWIGNGAGEVKFIKLGPFQSLLLGVGLLAILGLGLFFLSGLFLILAPVVALLGVGAWLSGLIGGGSNRRLR